MMAGPFDPEAEVSDIRDPEAREILRRMVEFHNDLWCGRGWRRRA